MQNQKFDRIFITGDQHGDIENISYLNFHEHLSENDLVISLGDFGVPYWSASKKNKIDIETFELFNQIYTNYAIIQGNHSKRFERVKWFRQTEFCGGNSFYLPQYPNFHFLQNGEVYNFNNMTFLVIGGGYSVDKYIRIAKGWTWEPEEKLNDEEKSKIRNLISANANYDFILTHVAPLELQPTWLFLNFVDQSTVETDEEEFLSEVREKIDYQGWFFGHYHGDYIIGEKEYLLFNEYIEINNNTKLNFSKNFKIILQIKISMI